MVPSMVPWSSAGTTSDSGMPTPVAPSLLIFCAFELGAVDAQLLAAEIRKPP